MRKKINEARAESRLYKTKGNKIMITVIVRGGKNYFRLKNKVIFLID